MGCNQSNAGTKYDDFCIFWPQTAAATFLVRLISLELAKACTRLLTSVPHVRRVVVGGAPRNPGVQTSGNTVRVPAPWKADSALTQAKLDSDRTVRRPPFSALFQLRLPFLAAHAFFQHAPFVFQTFWDTTARIQGNQRAWEAIRVAADALLNGVSELANTILEVCAQHSVMFIKYTSCYFCGILLCLLRPYFCC